MNSAWPVRIATIPKNSRQQIQVSLSRWKGFDLVDVRVFAVVDSGSEPVATKAGVSLRTANLPDLIQALEAALVEARRLGVLR